MSLPYMPLYIDDYEADTAHLSLIEDGIYSRLLRLCWRTPRCRLPHDIEWITRKVRANSEAERDALKTVLDEFFTIRRGYVFSKRLSAEYEQICVTTQKRKEAGKLGGHRKALKDKGSISGRAKAGPQHPEPEPEPDEKPNGFSKRASAQKPAGFVQVRKTTDAINDILQELGNDDQGRIGYGSESDRSDVPMLPAVRTG